MTDNERALEVIYHRIHECRLCAKAIPSPMQRQVNPRSVCSPIALMAQAPSELGVRVSGRHWVGDDGRIRRGGGAFLDKYLRELGFTVSWDAPELAAPYTTNVMHCFPGKQGKRDRRPSTTELRTCKRWWLAELEIVRPKAIVLMSAPSAESFGRVVGDARTFRELLGAQGEDVDLWGLTAKRFVLPHPTAPYRWTGPSGQSLGKGDLYRLVFERVAGLL